MSLAPPLRAVDDLLWQDFGAGVIPTDALWSEQIPRGGHWSWRVKRGTALRFVALGARANCSVVLYSALQPLWERYNLPDSVKAQHTARYTKGHVLMSDMGRAMASLIDDTVGWHDPMGALLDDAAMERKYGIARYEQHRNAMNRSGRDGLLIEIGKYGLTARDLIAPVNLFSKISVDDEGAFLFQRQENLSGAAVTLRCDMDLLIAVSCAPHPLDPHPRYEPAPVGVVAYKVGPATMDDLCRNACPEAQRAHYNADIYACE